MKTKICPNRLFKNVVRAQKLLLILMLATTGYVSSAQTLCSFGGTNGANPYGALTLGNDGNFYGTTAGGGVNGEGTVFEATTNGAIITWVSFNGTNGANPYAGLTLGGDGNFYGTTYAGGGSGAGTVFRVATNGCLTTLISFNNTNGANPQAGLTPDGAGNFYGTTYGGGSNDLGTVFRVTTNGCLTTLVSFNGDNGSWPLAGLTPGNDGDFYGTTYGGGDSDYGTVFQMTTNGALTTLASFDGENGSGPFAGLTLGPDGNFYGTTYERGDNDYGTVFQITTNGALTTLVAFGGTNGSYPFAGLTLGGAGTFYGTTYSGGSSNYGTVFEITTNGTFTTAFSFDGTQGVNPYAGFTLGNDGNFYGTTWAGGASNVGTVFFTSAPIISKQPASQLKPTGKKASFSVTASSLAPLSYQWYFTNPALQSTALAVAETEFGFCYGVTVTNEGSGYTETPQVQFIGGGGNGASGTAVLANGQVTGVTMLDAGMDYTNPPAVLIDPPNGFLTGETNATLSFKAVATNNAGDYYVVITNLFGSTTSSVASLILDAAPVILQQPQSETNAFGYDADFDVTASGTATLLYQWWEVAAAQTNAVGTPFVTNGFLLGVTITNGGAGYLAVPTLKFVGGGGSGASGTITLSNGQVTAITMLNAGFGYTNAPAVQIGAPAAVKLTSQITSNLFLAGVTYANAQNYFVVVTNSFGSVTSAPATLTITGAAYVQPQGLTLTTTNGGLSLQFSGTPAYPYVLESATNLSAPVNWQPILTNPANANGNWTLTLTNNPTIPTTFYRAGGQ